MTGPLQRLLRVTAALAVVVIGFSTAVGAASRKADVALARKALIVRTDFPTGWTASPSGSGNSNGPFTAPLATCLGVSKAEVNYNPPNANSPTFSENSFGLSVDDEVEVLPSVQVAVAQFNLIGSTRSAHCLAYALNVPSVKAWFQHSMGAGFKIGTATATALARPVTTNQSAALEYQLPFVYKGQKFILSSEVVVILSKSRTEASELSFTSAVGQLFPSSVMTQLEVDTVKRLK